MQNLDPGTGDLGKCLKSGTGDLGKCLNPGTGDLGKCFKLDPVRGDLSKFLILELPSNFFEV